MANTTKKKESKKDFDIAIDSRVQISDDNGEVTSDIWIVDATDDAVIALTHTENGRVQRVHYTRIAHILSGEDQKVDNPNFQAELDVAEEKATKAKTKSTKPKAPAKEPAAPELVNFRKMSEDGEIWTKDIPFDHADTKAQAHCIIKKDGKQFTAFNTYNGSFGKKGINGTSFIITDIKALLRKRKHLEKKGYECVYENDELNQLIAGSNTSSIIDLSDDTDEASEA